MRHLFLPQMTRLGLVLLFVVAALSAVSAAQMPTEEILARDEDERAMTAEGMRGVLGALLGQGLKLPEAAWTAVYAHGLSADLMVARRGRLGLIATDVAKGMCNVWTRWNR